MSEDLNERITKLEVTVSDHTKQLEKQLDKNESLVKLSTLMEMQVEMNKEQNVTMKKFGDTLTKVDKNLDNLNSSQQTLQREVVQIGNRVEEIEQKPLKFLWKAVGWAVGVATFLLTAYLVYKFGWNNNN